MSEENIRCDICGHNELKQICSIEAKRYAKGRTFDIFRCKNCRLIFLPVPSIPGSLLNYYPDNYLPHDLSRGQKSFLSRTLMDHVRRFAFTPPNDSTPGAGRYMQRLLATAYNKTAYRSIPNCKKNCRLLDIGCGLGSYLSMIKKIGWDGVGIEINKKAARYGRDVLGLNVKAGLFEEIDFPQKSFDVITMWHSLEHFPSPRRALIKAGRAIKDDGLILIGIPNHDSLDRMIFKEHWNGFEVPLHLYHFTPKTIRKLLESTGFKIEKIIHTIRPADTQKSIMNVLSDQFNPARHLTVKKFLYLPALLLAFFLSMVKRSSIIIVHAKKSNNLSV